jgi:hypothetical protein
MASVPKDLICCGLVKICMQSAVIRIETGRGQWVGGLNLALRLFSS